MVPAAVGAVEAAAATVLALDVAALLYLSPEEAARLARIGHLYREGAAAPATLRALRTDVRRWTTWCRAEGRGPLPARPADLAAFVLAHRARWTPATLRRCLASLARLHRVLRLTDPTKDEEVRGALRAVARGRAAMGQGGQRQATGITAAVLEALLAPLGESLIDRRDRALVLVGRDLLARRSELAALRVEDLTPSPGSGATRGGATVRIGRSKTDQEGQGATLYIGPTAWAAVQAWRQAATAAGADLSAGPLFRPVHVTGRVRDRALRAVDVHDVVRKLADRAAPALERLGIAPAGVRGHSCRVGMAQDLVAAGFDLAAIMQAGRWQSSTMVARYTAAQQAERGAVAQFHARAAEGSAHAEDRTQERSRATRRRRG
jgi:site-specific recombinase XerD